MKATISVTTVLICCLCASALGADLVHTTATLSQARAELAATSVGNKVLFAGGRVDVAGASNVVDIYDSDTGLWSTATLSQARWGVSATTVGTKALFAGGYLGGASSSDVVDIYDGETGLWSTAILSQARSHLAAATVGNKAFFGCSSFDGEDAVDIYDAVTGLWSTASLSDGRYALAATAVGDAALFAGGWGGFGVDSDVVDIYHDGTGVWSTASLSQARSYLTATAVGDKALFAGGEAGPFIIDSPESRRPSRVVDFYDSQTHAWSTASLSRGRASLAAATAGSIALFAGGWYWIDGDLSGDGYVGQADLDLVLADWGHSGPGITNPRADANEDGIVGQSDLDYVLGNWGVDVSTGWWPVVDGRSNVVDVYDNAGSLWSRTTLSQPRSGPAGAAAGNTALFAGGYGYDGASDVVDIYTVAQGQIPEPTACVLLLVGVVGVVLRRRNTRRVRRG